METQNNVAFAELPAGLPNPLVFADGEAVTSPQKWRQKRRLEILKAFETFVYGHAPVGRPLKQFFHVGSSTVGMMAGAATRQVITLTLPAPHGGKPMTVSITVFVPSAARHPCPAFVFICNRDITSIDPDRKTVSPFWPAERLIARGYAAVAFQVDDFDPDDKTGYERGVRALLDENRSPDSWGTIAAWSWGASRVMDYLEKLPAIDANRVAVIGHSRGGKAALWCGAQDERFALTISNNSGCTGAALARGKIGERIADINESFPHWFCDNYKKFNNRENDLPVDQHELLALIAPRLVYVASATGDAWADPSHEFLACVAAAPVFQLLGKEGVGTDKMPPPETPLQTGSIGYHLRTGKHDLTPWDWDRYMDFADTHWHP